jgi:hypothetical protein
MYRLVIIDTTGKTLFIKRYNKLGYIMDDLDMSYEKVCKILSGKLVPKHYRVEKIDDFKFII